MTRVGFGAWVIGGAGWAVDRTQRGTPAEVSLGEVAHVTTVAVGEESSAGGKVPDIDIFGK